MKKGDIFYKAVLIIESARNEKSFVEIEEWHITKINSCIIYLNQKIELVTWGKLSTKIGDYGFFKNINSYYKDSIINNIDKVVLKNEFESRGYFKTKTSAFKSIKKDLDKKVNELLRIQKRVNKAIGK